MNLDISDYADSIKGILTYKLTNKEFCADIKSVLTVINPFETPVNLDSDFNNSMIRYKEELIPLFDLHSIFGINKHHSYEITERIVVLEVNDKTFAFLVDSIIEIISFNKNNKELICINNGDAPYTLAMLNYQNITYVLPDYKNILRDSVNPQTTIQKGDRQMRFADKKPP